MRLPPRTRRTRRTRSTSPTLPIPDDYSRLRIFQTAGNSKIDPPRKENVEKRLVFFQSRAKRLRHQDIFRRSDDRRSASGRGLVAWKVSRDSREAENARGISIMEATRRSSRRRGATRRRTRPVSLSFSLFFLSRDRSTRRE